MLRFLSTLFVIASAHAYRQDLAKLPNGNSYGLTLGHPGGNTKVPTKLASTFYGAGQTWSKAFCMADADGDGQSNGLEMGDPCCRWSIGQAPQFTTGLSDPNSAASKTLNTMSSCIMANANQQGLGNPGPGVCACNGNIFDVGSCDSADCYNLCDKRGLGHGVCTTKYKASREIRYEDMDEEADTVADIVADAVAVEMDVKVNANAKLQCAVCVQALQLDLAKPSDNAAEFSLTSVKSCKDATQDDDQKLRCVAALIKNADQLVMDQKNGVAPIQSCMNLGLMCMAPPPTQPPTTAPTKAPPTTAPTPTAAPSAAPITPSAAPTKFPTAPPPPRTNSMLPGPGVCACGKARIDVNSCDSAECYEACDKKNLGHGVCATKKVLQVAAIPATAIPAATETSIMLPFVIASVVSTVSILIISFALWRYQKNKQEKEALLQTNDNDFHALPDIVY